MRTLLFTGSMLSVCLALADQPIMVDPHDFTRTPCEYRESPCPAYSMPLSLPTDNTILDSGRVAVTLTSGMVIEATVYLISISSTRIGTLIERRVIVEYESMNQEIRSKKIRAAVFAHLTSVPEEYGVTRADVAACRPSSQTCQVSSFVRDEEWALIR